jgi:hypothetical protein
MESYFAPSTRFQDQDRPVREADEDDDDEEENFRRYYGDFPWNSISNSDSDSADEDEASGNEDTDHFAINDESLDEVEFTGGSAENILLHRGCTWMDFVLAARGKIVWINADAFFNFDSDVMQIMKYDRSPYNDFMTVFTAFDGTSESNGLVKVCASSVEHATVACDIMLQLLTTSEDPKIKLESSFANEEIDAHFPVTGPALSYFLVQSRNLLHLELSRFRLNADQCHAIDAIDASTNVDLELELSDCFPTEQGEIILVESIKQDRGPTKLRNCQIDTRHLADAIRGNDRVNFLAPYDENESLEARLEFYQALAENEGITNLRLDFDSITDESWTALWRSVSHHPKLERISLNIICRGCSDAQKTLRTQAIMDALRINTVLLRIALHHEEFDKVILKDAVYPRLQANRYRPRVAAIATEKGEWRRKLLGQALVSVASNPSLIWMFLSSNVNSLISSHIM